ncbi:Ig-like domain-containing protein [Bacillus sp. EB01]|uniref:Ig-like domain-containing protein n=1 Tax=Bacillus sp. EB01 TaxID=1347086 RepID=UPI0005C5FCA0|nr:Ig-like domain-containing protein [Bacillus sp. EB01]
MVKRGLIGLLVLIVCLAGVVPAKADNDTTPLILKDASITGTEFRTGDIITMQFTVEDDFESGPADDANINLMHSSGQEINSMMRYTGENNTYEFSYRADNSLLQGDWYVSDISLYDKAGNLQTYDTSSPLISKLRFRMLEGGADTTAPELTSVNLNTTAAKPGDKVIVTIGYKEEGSGLSHGTLTLRHIETLDYNLSSDIYLNSATGKYEAEITIPKYTKNGVYDIGNLSLADNAGNKRTYWAPSFPVLAEAQLTISGASTDTTRPVFHSITVDKKELYPGDSLNVVVNGSDSGSGIARVQVQFTGKEFHNAHDIFWGNLTPTTSTNQWEGTLQVPKSATEGTYYIELISLRDGVGNTTNIEVTDNLPTVKVLPVFTGITAGAIKKGAAFDPMAGIKFFSNLEGDRTKDIAVKSPLDINTNGIYLLTYSMDTYSAYRWMTVNDHQASDPTYFNENVKIDFPPNSSVSLWDGSTIKTIFTATTVTKDGTYQLTTNTGGTPGAARKTVKFIIDRVKPAAPVLNTVYSQSVSVSGKAEAYSTVKILKNGVYLVQGKADATGKYSVRIPKQRYGTRISVQAIDRAGNAGIASVKTVLYVPGLDPVSNLSTYVTGKSFSKSKIKVYSNGVLIKTGYADSYGNYKIAIPRQAAGKVMKVVETSASGKNFTSLPVTVSDKIAPAAPVLNNVYSQSVAVTGKAEAYSTVKISKNGVYLAQGKADATGKFSVRIPKQRYGTKISVQATDRAGNVGSASVKTVLYVPGLDPVSNLSTYVTGKSFSKSKIKVYSNGVLIKTGYADSYGNYKITIPRQAAGKIMKVVETSVSGKNFTSLPVKVSDKIAPATPVVNKVTTSSVYVTGTAEKSATILVNVGTKQIASGKATTTGTFKIAIPKQKLGTILTVYAVDASKNKSKPATVKVQ